MKKEQFTPEVLEIIGKLSNGMSVTFDDRATVHRAIRPLFVADEWRKAFRNWNPAKFDTGAGAMRLNRYSSYRQIMTEPDLIFALTLIPQ